MVLLQFLKTFHIEGRLDVRVLDAYSDDVFCSGLAQILIKQVEKGHFLLNAPVIKLGLSQCFDGSPQLDIYVEDDGTFTGK